MKKLLFLLLLIPSLSFAASGTDPDVTTAGRMSLDTNDHLARGYDGAAQYSYGEKIRILFGLTMLDPSSSSDDIKIKAPYNWVITAVHGHCIGGTNVTGGLYEVDSDGDDTDAVQIDSGDYTFLTGASADTTISTNATIDANDWLQWDTTSVSESVSVFNLVVWGYIDSDVD